MVKANVSYDVMDKECSQTVTSWEEIEAAEQDAKNRCENGEKDLTIAKVTIVPLKKYSISRNVDIEEVQPDPAMTVENFN